MKTINNFITEKLKLRKDSMSKYKKPEKGMTCYDIGGGEHKVIDFADIHDLKSVHDIIALDDTESKYKRELMTFIKKNKNVNAEYLVIVTQHMGPDYVALWDNEDNEIGWTYVWYEKL